MKERSVKTNMFENFIKQDVDDMIFGSTKQIISERWDPLYRPRESVAFLFLSPERRKRAASTGIFVPRGGFFLPLHGVCDILFRLM